MFGACQGGGGTGGMCHQTEGGTEMCCVVAAFIFKIVCGMEMSPMKAVAQRGLAMTLA